MWFVDTELGSFGGNAPPGEEPVVRSVADLAEAQALASIRLLAPTYLPEGYALCEIKLAPADNVFLFYGGPGFDVLVIQQAVGPRPGDAPNELGGQMVGLVTTGTLEEVELDGRTAVWADERTLLWEENGVSYTIGGLDLTLEDAIHIAKSLE
jgi:hypothetical protein